LNGQDTERYGTFRSGIYGSEVTEGERFPLEFEEVFGRSRYVDDGSG
jgi:hypothetical protein